MSSTVDLEMSDWTEIPLAEHLAENEDNWNEFLNKLPQEIDYQPLITRLTILLQKKPFSSSIIRKELAPLMPPLIKNPIFIQLLAQTFTPKPAAGNPSPCREPKELPKPLEEAVTK